MLSAVRFLNTEPPMKPLPAALAAAALFAAAALAAPTATRAADSADADSISTRSTPTVDSTNKWYVSNRPPLAKNPLIKLPIGSIAPKGWLRGQLTRMASGMTGHLPEVSPWCNIKTSAWASPTGSGEYPWEEAPYWLKGFGDLGYVLKDKRITDEAKQWIDGFLAGQMDDGYLGPRVNVETKDKPVGLAGGTEKLDLWPNMIMLNVLQSRYEATGDPRILPAMTKYFRWQLNLPEDNILPGYWDRMRGGDNLESIYWLYNRTGDKFLLEAAEKVHKSTAPWSKQVPNWHGVNITQGFREGTIWSMQSHDAGDKASAERNYDEVIGKYGQMPGGMFAADENAREGFNDPRQGAETCSMVEFTHSFQMLTELTGDPQWADRCEDVAFNSLPAALTADMRGLHYLTAANDVALTTADKSPGIQNGGNMYAYTPDGDPNRCCQHNHGQGWPYYAENLYMATQNNGLAAVLYAPSSVTAKVGAEGNEVTVEQTTAYPFNGTVNFAFTTKSPTAFPMLFRVPGWAKSATLKINGTDEKIDFKPDAYIRVDRTWKDGDKVELTFPTPIRVKTWAENKNAVSVYKGPLAFSLKIGQDAKPFWNKKGRTIDWVGDEITPTTPWNYGLVLDAADPAGSFTVVSSEVGPDAVPDQPFTIDAAPIVLKATAKRIANWQTVKGDLADVLQPSPVKVDAPDEVVELIPMGAARLRISAFPVIGTGPDAREWKAPPSPPLHTASATFEGDTIAAIDDGILPSSSHDGSIPRFTWWPRRGTTEWIIYRTPKLREVATTSVYWYDDTGAGDCRTPQSWTLLYKDGDTFKPVKLTNGSTYGTAVDKFNKITFAPVKTDQFKLVAKFQPNKSAGILEWQVGPQQGGTAE